MSKRDELRDREPVDGYRILVTPDERDDLLAVVDAVEKVLELIDFLLAGTSHADEDALDALRAAVARVTEGGQT